MAGSTLKSMEQAKQARAKTLAAYREKSYHKLELTTSGLTIWVRDASVTDLMLLGKLPQALLSVIMKAAENADKDKEKIELDLNQFAGSPDFGALVNGIVMVCAVEPPVTELSDDDHLAIYEIPSSDRLEIFAWANREVAANADGFQPEQGSSEQPVPAAQPG
jgi:hypothetical protein